MAALNILGIGDEQQGNLLGIPGAQVLDISPPTQAGQGERPVEQRDALASVYNNVTDYIKRERQRSSDMGLWNDETGLPTGKGLLSAAQQTANALLMGTTAPRSGSLPALSLERTTLPREWAQPNNHRFTINRAGEEVGSIHTEYNPQTGELYVQDIEGHRGPQSFGPAAIRQLREELLQQYPEARTLSGYRSTGAGPDREVWQRVNQYQGRGE